MLNLVDAGSVPHLPHHPPPYPAHHLPPLHHPPLWGGGDQSLPPWASGAASSIAGDQDWRPSNAVGGSYIGKFYFFYLFIIKKVKYI